MVLELARKPVKRSPRLRQVYTPWSPGIQASWTVSQVRTALTSHEQGNFNLSSQLWDAMGRDDRFAATLDTRIRTVLGLPFSLDAAEEGGRRAVSIRDKLWQWWFDLVPESELYELIRWYHGVGHGVGELIWQPASSEWRARLRVHHPQYTYWSDFDEGLMVSTEEGIQKVTPGDGKWVLLSNGDRGYMHGAVRSLAIAWLGRQFAFRDYLRYSERHGMPIIVAGVPAIEEDDRVEDFKEALLALASETTITLPTYMSQEGAKYELELLEATSQTYEGFERLIGLCNTAYAIRLLGQNLTTEVTGGSYAAESGHERVMANLMRGDVEIISTCLHDQVCRPVVSVNYGQAQYAPWPSWQADPPSDTLTDVKTLREAANTLIDLKAAGYRPKDMATFEEMVGVALEPVAPAVAPSPSDGQKPPEQAPAAQEQPENEHDGEPEPEEASQTVRLASGDSPADARGFIAGQLYVDGIVERGVAAASAALAPDLAVVLRAIREAESYEQLERELTTIYAAMSPERLAETLEKASILAELDGRWSVLEDL